MRDRFERTRPDAHGGRRRRDPHGEREADRRRAAAPAEAGEGTARVRRDPRAERAARAAASITPVGAPVPAAKTELPRQPEPAPRVIDDPRCLVLAVPDLDGGGLSSHDRDLLGAARQLADGSGGAVVLLACMPATLVSVETFAVAGADRVLAMIHPDFAAYAPELKAHAVLEAIRRLAPVHTLFPDRPIGGGDVGRRVAIALGERPAVGVRRLDKARVSARTDGGRSAISRPPPAIILVDPECADPVAGPRHEARVIEAMAIVGRRTIEDEGYLPLDAAHLPLAEADFIVSGGNGIADWQTFHALARDLGAAEGGSRAACDAGHLARDRQVGTSGTLVEPRCYLAFGISGAPQHLAGIARCERVVAVNTDLHAEMIKRADLAIVADAQGVMPALRARLARERP